MPKPLRLLTILCFSFLGIARAAMAGQDYPLAEAAAKAAPEACHLADAPRAEFIVQAPFDVVDGRIYVQARVNGGGLYRFAVDTGASGIGRADTSLAVALGLQARGRASTTDGVQTATVDTVALDTLALGGLERKGVDVIKRDYGSRLPAEARFHGILARDFFADGLLVLDYPRKILSFSRTMSLPSMGQGMVGYARPFRVPVLVGDTQVEANLDTGANVGFLMPLALYTQLGKEPLTPAGAGSLTNTRIDTWRGRVAGPVTIGAVSLADVETRVSDRFPEMLVGAHVLQNFVVLIDQRAKRIAVCGRSADAAESGRGLTAQPQGLGRAPSRDSVRDSASMSTGLTK